jgi:hypothetical protein
MEPLAFVAGVNTFGAKDEGWPLAAVPGEEDRLFRARVSFEQPLRSVPIVHLGLVGFDVGNEDAARLRVRAENISADGFDIVFETWLNTKIWSVSVSWLAVGT